MYSEQSTIGRDILPRFRNMLKAIAPVCLILLVANLQAKEPVKSGKKPAAYIEPKMVHVDGGQFRMGDNRRTDEVEEMPEHIVNVSSFSIAKYEVTVAEFRKFMNSHTYKTDAEKDGLSWVWDGKSLILSKFGVTWECDVLGNKRVHQEDHPVMHVSRNDAMAYCAWLSKQTGKNYRLPTEAEWEYAAKGGPHQDTFQYSGGSNMDSLGWYAYNSGLVEHKGGLKKPNRLGIYDMSGNMWEWCSDWFGMYIAGEQTDPKGPATGEDGVLRGGAWRYFPIRTRCTARRQCLAGFNGCGIGFRIAASDPKK